MNQIAAKDSKAKILDAFQQILAERQKIESNVATKEEEAQKAENQRVLEAASQYTADSIVRGLADLQLDFGTIISGLSAKFWEQEQEEHEALLVESNELLSRERTRQEEDYKYETERSHTISADEYEAARRKLERELQEIGQTKEKQWAERERILAANQSLLEEYRRKVEAIPAELDEAVKKAREEGIRETYQEAKVKADLQEKEWESTKQGYELQLQSLEAKIQKHTEQITEISTQLQAAMRQAQELAMRAFESSSNRLAVKQEG